jgi:hypothetical protein
VFSFLLKTAVRLLQITDLVGLGFGLAMLVIFIRPHWDAYED